ncbi:MAG: hypothetical protein K5683_00980 [Prevotella sp.]|nr:hypothetical protein [Prevotella sp.]
MKKRLLLMSAMLLAVSGTFAQKMAPTKAVAKKAHYEAKAMDARSSKAEVFKASVSTAKMAPMEMEKVTSQSQASLSRSRAPRKTMTDGVWYQRPVGSLYISGGSDPDYYSYVYIPGLVEGLYKNMADKKVSAKWTLVGSQETTSVEGNEDNDLQLTFPKIPSGYISSYYIPQMTVGNTSYTFGENFPNNPDVALINGDSVMTLTDVNLCAGYYYGFSNGGSFGNRTGKTEIDGQEVDIVSDAIYEFYNKPIKPLYLTDVFFRVVNFDGTALMNEGTEMKVIIRKIDEEGNIADVIAEMPFSLDDATYIEEDEGKTFGAFIVSKKDTDAFGTEYDVPILIEDEFVVIISGFEQEGVNFSIYMTGDLKDVETDSFLNNGMVTPTCRSYVRADNGEPLDGLYYCQAITKEQSDQYNKEDGDDYDWTRHYNAVLHLDAMTDVVNVLDGFEKMYAENEGGPVFAIMEEQNAETGEMENVAYTTLQYESTLPRLSTWEGMEGEDNYTFEDLPDWLKITEYNDDYYTDYDVTLAALEADPLPEGVKGRKAEIRIVSERGADSGIITIIQGEDPDDIIPEKEITDGKYFLVNIASNKCWGAGNDWGTRASLVKNLEYVTLLKQSDGTYFLESQVSNGGTSYYFGGDYMDGSPIPLTITKLDESFGQDMNDNPMYTYYISNAEGQYFGYDGSTTVLGKNIDITTETGKFYAQWIIASEEEALAALKNATVDDPNDATFLILDPNFGRNNRNVGAWIVSDDCTNKNLSGGDNVNNCAESYHSVFTINQLLENVPNGVYKMTAQGFYRQDGSDEENLPYFFINDQKAVFPALTGTENSMSAASASFTNGLYTIEPIYVEVKDGKIDLGVKLENNANLWCIWDNFELTYYGPDATIEQAKAAAFIEELENLKDKAEDLVDQVDNDAIKSALADAIAATADVTAASGEEAVKDAINKLAGVVDLAEGNVIAKNVLPAMKALVDGTNVYTEEALNTYYTQWNNKYTAGTLTKAEAGTLQNPDVVTGWHADITVDNFLLSAWDTNPDFNNAPYYINTWSTEGDNDGSNFRVPFFEYWTSDDASLGEKTLTATMTGLEKGTYKVTALVRVRVKNGESNPTGIALQANDGTAADVTEGAQVGSSQFFLQEAVAQGEVGEDGTLLIKFNIAADNNISWLSFKNVKFEKSHTWNFTAWSPATVENLKAEAAKGLNEGLWSDGEKSDGSATTAEISAGNCFWQVGSSNEAGETLTANGEEIAELKGLIFKNNKARSLAIAVNYGDCTSANGAGFGPYNGPAYLWLGGKNIEYFTIPAVKGGTTITMGVESHKFTDARGVQLLVNGEVLKDAEGNDVAYPTNYTVQTWQVPAGIAHDVVIKNNNGCHIYFIDAEQDQEVLTSISNVKVSNSNLNGTIYNLNGQRVDKAQKGLYIINGKKVVK